MDGDGLLCGACVFFSMNVNPERRRTAIRHPNPSPGESRPGASGLLGLSLLGDVLDGEALLADDCSHILGRHDDAKVLL